LEVILPNVSERDREVMIELLGTRDGKRKTLREVAEKFDISHQRVSQLRKKVRNKLVNKIL
jgi:DNA-directed RNA polymerase sigma subunit (sigma70/sigma32)